MIKREWVVLLLMYNLYGFAAGKLRSRACARHDFDRKNGA
jgi:hypothetical protein